MARTKADGGCRKAIGGKAAGKVRSVCPSKSKPGKPKAYSSRNPVRKRPTPAWQKGIQKFFDRDEAGPSKAPESDEDGDVMAVDDSGANAEKNVEPPAPDSNASGEEDQSTSEDDGGEDQSAAEDDGGEDQSAAEDDGGEDQSQSVDQDEEEVSKIETKCSDEQEGMRSAPESAFDPNGIISDDSD